MRERSVKITKVDNGYVLEWIKDTDSNPYISQTFGASPPKTSGTGVYAKLKDALKHAEGVLA